MGRYGRVRRPIRPLVAAGIALAVVIIGAVAVASWPGPEAEADAQGDGARSGASRAAASPATGTEAEPEPGTTRSPEEPKTKPTPKPTPKPTTSADVPVSGPGTFTTAQSQGDPVGSGPPRRYSVQVENGVDVSAADAAGEIEKILAHPQGWAAHGRGSFQLVSSGADFVIRIATPATADKLCLAQGLNTRGELNCETVDGVVVNLRRWVLGSPQFDGEPSEYRHLIINHEVGHEIGLRQHLGCGGPGKLAPVMMQQIKGLDGCRSNAWPYDKDGTYVDGPGL
ncbi:DUF3152 domain-containing protein [Streptomyces sp. NPDC101062]|uniref:DUF3152 domain-containing protein n=1 Tax=unclassified Streptomyces TaxID=2593676 RepID=UPI002E7A4D6E|nr:DUF3152 domain-containing protein [Streptomyces sp. JV176]MEE1799812.1 DUF3152 domain-containing protein [Streptomyces sp. JV176]